MPAVSSPPYGYASVGYLFQRPPPYSPLPLTALGNSYLKLFLKRRATFLNSRRFPTSSRPVPVPPSCLLRRPHCPPSLPLMTLRTKCHAACPRPALALETSSASSSPT